MYGRERHQLIEWFEKKVETDTRFHVALVPPERPSMDQSTSEQTVRGGPLPDSNLDRNAESPPLDPPKSTEDHAAEQAEGLNSTGSESHVVHVNLKETAQTRIAEDSEQMGRLGIPTRVSQHLLPSAFRDENSPEWRLGPPSGRFTVLRRGLWHLEIDIPPFIAEARGTLRFFFYVRICASLPFWALAIFATWLFTSVNNSWSSAGVTLLLLFSWILVILHLQSFMKTWFRHERLKITPTEYEIRRTLDICGCCSASPVTERRSGLVGFERMTGIPYRIIRGETQTLQKAEHRAKRSCFRDTERSVVLEGRFLKHKVGVGFADEENMRFIATEINEVLQNIRRRHQSP